MVLIDTPPVGLVSDALDILKKVDIPIYIVRANYSARTFLKNINDIILESKIRNLSIILNDAGMGTGGYGAGGYGLGYGYGYGYCYGYGYKNKAERYGYGYYSDGEMMKRGWFNFLKPKWRRDQR